MADKKLGKQSLRFQNPPTIIAGGTVVGPMEGSGPLGKYFDEVLPDNLFGQKSFEAAEMQLIGRATDQAIKKVGLQLKDLEFMLAGDLINQIICSSYCARDMSIPFFGIFNACATFTEGLILGSALVEGSFCDRLLVGVSSHHEAAERQYRYPVEMGNQRLPTAQWTVTGGAVSILQGSGQGPRVTYATVGKVVDIGHKDPNDMGSAMAPAAADTIKAHFEDTQRAPDYYDLILTGDLGAVGKDLVQELLRQQKIDLGDRYDDCGLLIYDQKTQDVHSGGSGPACSGAVFNGYVLNQMSKGKVNRVLLVATGSLHNVTTFQQGESMPAIAHAVAIEQ